MQTPEEHNRNSANVLAVGLEKTGSTIIRYGNELLGFSDLAHVDLLDVGCGTRFTQTIINCDMPIRSYTGIDIHPPLVTFLKDTVKDPRFTFHYWNAHNQMYHPSGEKLTAQSNLPLESGQKFDLIWMYSVITHNTPEDTANLLHILRRYIRKDGALLLSAFIDNSIDKFEDRLKDQPLVNAYYHEDYLKQLAAQAGWIMTRAPSKQQDHVIQNIMICRPKLTLWEKLWPWA